MPRPVKLDAHGLRPRRLWPMLPEETQKQMIDFLAWYRAVADQGATKAGQLADMAQVDAGMRETAAWWAHAVRACDWLLSYVGNRQEYLEIELAIKEKRWIPPTTKPGT